ncbi:hypothetical protein SAMN05216358_0067 [Rhizobium sp. AN5]|uniref:hypothetical protein n=1 Tax=Rhizobium sp. AN5 TaxID=1855304 RepID=UPI000BD033B1|nr:hypothetical protein [Rhizobium sp. AN5]SOC90048.1 hypothetical protein SAMN05216358_0067 [Rhizobium sp. AN5]
MSSIETVDIHEIETLPGGAATLQVISIEDKLEGDKYFVRLQEVGNPDEYEDTPFEDYPQAYAHYRNTLRTLGISVAYHAPVQVSFAEDRTAAPTRGAVEVFYEFHGELSRFGAGMIEATAVRDRFMADPDFIEHANEIFALAGTDKNDWKAATIRTACRRVAAVEKAESDRRIQEQLGSVSGFGAF